MRTVCSVIPLLFSKVKVIYALLKNIFILKNNELINLSNTSIESLTAAFNAAFEGYYIPVNYTEEGMLERIKRARIDLSLSVGVMEDDQLIAFMLTGVGQQAGALTAYNAGTGVLERFRGQRLVGEMYEWIVPRWQELGFQRASLEVITENEKAIKAYQRAGFTIKRRLKAFKKDIDNLSRKDGYSLQTVTMPDWEGYQKMEPFTYAWDYTREGIEALSPDYRFYEWGQPAEAYAIVHRMGRIAQAGLQTDATLNWRDLLIALEQAYSQLSWVNLSEEASVLQAAMDALNWEHIIDQYEMEREI